LRSQPRWRSTSKRSPSQACSTSSLSTDPVDSVLA
jgi:hypothetical protein